MLSFIKIICVFFINFLCPGWYGNHIRPVHLASAAWTSWSRCSVCCMQSRKGDGGQVEERLCSGENCAPPCTMSLWSPWSRCTLSANPSVSRRTRYLMHPSDALNPDCAKNQLTELYFCSNPDRRREACPSFGQWSSWSGTCSCSQNETMYQTRRRPCLALSDRAESEIRPCVAASASDASCDTDVDCVVGEWLEWSCTAECNGRRVGTVLGTAVRRRNVGLRQSGGPSEQGSLKCACPVREEHALCALNCNIETGGDGRGFTRQPGEA